jgi:hypothetical protein
VIDAKKGSVAMKTQEHRTENLERNRFEAEFEATIDTLFRACPALCGFSVRRIYSEAALGELVERPVVRTNAVRRAAGGTC